MSNETPESVPWTGTDSPDPALTQAPDVPEDDPNAADDGIHNSG